MEEVEDDDDDEIMAVVIVVPPPTLGFAAIDVVVALVSLLITADNFLPPVSAAADSPSDTLSSLLTGAALGVSLRATDSSLLDDRILSRSSPLQKGFNEQ